MNKINLYIKKDITGVKNSLFKGYPLASMQMSLKLPRHLGDITFVFQDSPKDTSGLL